MPNTSIPQNWPVTRFPGLLFGGDYNPEQWTPAMGYDGESVWLDDLRLMREAGVNLATVGVFSWAALQPNEHTYTFEWLDRMLELLGEHGVFACLGTGTAAQPAWLSAAYPAVLPVTAQGQRRRPSSPRTASVPVISLIAVFYSMGRSS